MEAEASPFDTSDMLAEVLASTPLLSESWRLCSVANASPWMSFVAEQVDNVVYVAFSGIQMAGGSDPSWTNMVPLESIGDVPLFRLHRSKEGDEPAKKVMVHAGVLKLFWSVFKSIQDQMSAIMINTKAKSIVITGHSLGGAIASLCTLWLLSCLQAISASKSVLCITFGSPLLGNESFSRAILKERWGGNFCHVVSKHDIMPRLLFAPLLPLTSQLNFLLKFWHLSMTSPDFGKLAVQISDNEKAQLFASVIYYLEAATGDASNTMFHPFGSYYFVSGEGALCVDSATTTIKMMHLLLATSSPACSIEDHLKYGDYVNKLSLQFLKRRDHIQGNIPDSSYEAGLELGLQSLGIASQELTAIPAKECLKTARRVGRTRALNAANLAVSFSRVVPYRAEIEWYKTRCDESDDQLGYYDSFKQRGSSKRGMKVYMNCCKIARFWNSVIEMLENNLLPSDFEWREKWVNGAHSYKLLVEPLEIAEYYRKGKHRTNGHYLKNGREKRFEIFDRWWKDRGANVEVNNERSKFASLTQDSCFWARVEEARDWLDNVRSESDTSKLAVLWDNIEKFEKYAMTLVEAKEVSKDVLAKNSSYKIWLEELRGLRELKARMQTFPPQATRFLDGGVVP